MFEGNARLSRDDKRRFIAAVMKVDEADAALKGGDTAGAFSLYRAAIELCPPCRMRGDFRVILGGHLFDQGEAAAAEAEFRAALTDGCGYPHEALRRLAFARAAQGAFDAAVAAMHRAAKEGEDLAFASQAIVAFGVALGRIDEARSLAEDGPELADCAPEYRRRLALAAAELALLSNDRARLRASLDVAAAVRAEDGTHPGSDEILRQAVLDRVAGRLEPRPETEAAFAADPQDWAAIAWEILCGRAVPPALMARLEQQPWGIRAESLALYRRLAGLLAERAGNFAAARRHYDAARIEPFTQWCLDYHLAGLGLARLGPGLLEPELLEPELLEPERPQLESLESGELPSP